MGLIVIEGLDGSGKSTQIDLLHEFLSRQGCRCNLLHFPRSDASVHGRLIARFLRGELGEIHQVNPYLVALMYADDRLDFKSTLEKWLREGNMVLLDRYVYSNVAYQCAKMQNESEKQALREWILHLEFVCYGLPKPDLNVYLDVPFTFTQRSLTAKRNGADRKYLQGEKDIHEADLQFQEQVRKTYLSLSGEEGFLKIDCGNREKMLPVEQVFDKILNGLKARKIKY
ncbi:MAG: dTMP kinase [Bacteroidales bacterium]|jgi:dTMP kinase|nr:dTMP kinase [Bacteroidales bacterium]